MHPLNWTFDYLTNPYQSDLLQNYEEALIYDPGCSRAHMGRAKALHALGRIKEARKAWQTVVDNFGPHDDLAVVETAINFIHSPKLCNPVASPGSPLVFHSS